MTRNSLTNKITVGLLLLTTLHSLIENPKTELLSKMTPQTNRLLKDNPQSSSTQILFSSSSTTGETSVHVFDNVSKLRKALFGKSFMKGSQTRIVVNLFLHFVIMTISLLLCFFGIRILYYLPFFLFFFSAYYLGLLINRFGELRDLSDPVLNLAWTIICFVIALALFIPLRKREQSLAINLGICLSIVVICIIGLYVFHLESKRAAIGSFLASVMMGTAFTLLGLKNLDNLLIIGSSLIGSLIFVTNLQIALEDQSMLTKDDQGLIYFVESPVMYFLSVALLFAVGLLLQKFQEKRELMQMENSIAEIRNNISLD